MPWKELKPMDQKIQMIADWQTKHFSKTDLSQKYGISRKTVYKWLYRYQKSGIDGLKELSRRPDSSPDQTNQEIIELIIKEKLKNRKRGPKKINAQLKQQYPQLDIPAPSTIGHWLKQNGLVAPRKRRRRVPPYNEPFIKCQSPNAIWSTDYKGQFYTKDGKKCYPLTISDNYSRYLLKCVGLPGPRYEQTRAVFESAFREYGLPGALRLDNGTPFAGRCIGGLSQLMVWWIQLGIIPERIDKGCPQQNGRHERMHRTLKAESLDPIAASIKEQQMQFDLFRHDYNNHRPHEALDQQPPAKYYIKSSRPFIEKPAEPEYDYSYMVRRVRHNGEIKLHGNMYYLTALLSGQPVGLKEVDDGIVTLYYSFYPLGYINLRKNKVMKHVLPMSPV
jgi:transposase InsO family protein